MAGRNREDLQRSIYDILQDLLIVELAKLGVPQQDIRKVVGVEMGRVTRLAKLLKKRVRGDNYESGD